MLIFAILEVFYSTGLRLAELAGLDVEDFDFFNETIRVVGKGLRTRRLQMTPELVSANELWQFERAERFGGARTGDPLFVTNGGERFTYGQLRYWLRGLNRLAGLRDYSLKALRLTAYDQLEEAGVSRREIGRLLGMDRPDHL